MKKTNKKGFTIVELVIVIVVIAILVAVMIPTMVHLVNKANIANDTAIAKNLNTAAITANADTFEEALEAAKDAGFLLSNLNSKGDDCYFVWEDDTNQFILYNLKEDKIIYSNTAVEGDPDDSWIFAVNSTEEEDAVKAVLNNVTIKMLAVSVNDLANILAAGGTVYLDESIALDKENLLVFDTADKTVTIDLGKSALNTTGILVEDGANIVPVEVKQGNVNFNGGYISTAGAGRNAHDLPIAVALRTKDGTTVNITGTSFENTNTAGQIKIGGTATLKDVTIKSTKVGVETFYNGKLTLENVTIHATKGGANDRGCCVWVCNYDHENFAGTGKHTGESVVTIKSGTYTSEGGVADYSTLVACGGDIIIEGGTFSAADGKIFSFGTASQVANDVSEIVIKGGTFNGVDFADLDTEAEWKALCKKNVTVTGVGTATVTIKAAA